MSRGVNKVILVGTLGKDPEIRYTQSGTAVTEVSIATNESWKDKNGEKQERTEWHRITFWGKLAEIAGEYLKKGAQVYVEGSLRTEKYTDKQGVEKYVTKVAANEMQMLGGRRDGAGDEDRRPQQNRSEGNRGSSGSNKPSGGAGPQREMDMPSRNDDPFPDDDIPF